MEERELKKDHIRNKCNLLIVHPDMSIGGTERQIVNLVKGLAETHDYKIFVCLYEFNGRFLSQLAAIHGVELIELKKKKAGYISIFRQLKTVIQNNQIDTIHTFLAGPNVLAGLLSFVTDVDRIVWGNRVTEFDPLQFGLKGFLTELLAKWLSSRVDTIVSNSFAGRRALANRGIKVRQSIVIPNGIDDARFSRAQELRLMFRSELGVSDSTIIIGQVGRIVDWKGHEVFLRAAHLLVKIHKNIVFLIVGGGDSKWIDHLKELSAKLQLDQKLFWLGPRNDVEVVLNGIDILTVPSTSGEGFPNIIAESMATETPVIATDIGATADILKNTGLLIDPQSEEQLVEGWSRMVSSRNYRNKLGFSGRKMIQKSYSIDQMVQQTQSVLKL